MAFTRASNLRRHIQHSCKGNKRPAAEELPENPLLPEKRPLVEYSSSEEEVPMDVDTRPFESWRAATEPS